MSIAETRRNHLFFITYRQKTVNNNTKLILIIIFSIAAVALAIYATGVTDNAFGPLSTPDSATSTADTPAQKPQTATPGSLMQPSQTAAPGDTQANDADEPMDADDADALQEALNDFYSSEDEQDREAALMTLGEFSDPKAKEALLYSLNDPEDSVREQAISQISNWENDKERQQMLLAAVNNDKPEIVVLALEAISEITDPALKQKVKELSNDANEDVSEAAKVALELAEF